MLYDSFGGPLQLGVVLVVKFFISEIKLKVCSLLTFCCHNP